MVAITMSGGGRPFGNADTDGEYFPFVRQEKVPVVSEESVSDRSDVLRSKLYREIKKNLHSSKKDDPLIRIEIDAQEDAYNNVSGSSITLFIHADHVNRS